MGPDVSLRISIISRHGCDDVGAVWVHCYEEASCETPLGHFRSCRRSDSSYVTVHMDFHGTYEQCALRLGSQEQVRGGDRYCRGTEPVEEVAFAAYSKVNFSASRSRDWVVSNFEWPSLIRILGDRSSTDPDLI